VRSACSAWQREGCADEHAAGGGCAAGCARKQQPEGGGDCRSWRPVPPARLYSGSSPAARRPVPEPSWAPGTRPSPSARTPPALGACPPASTAASASSQPSAASAPWVGGGGSPAGHHAHACRPASLPSIASPCQSLPNAAQLVCLPPPPQPPLHCLPRLPPSAPTPSPTNPPPTHPPVPAGVVPACASLDCLSVFAHNVSDGAEIAKVGGGRRRMKQRSPAAQSSGAASRAGAPTCSPDVAGRGTLPAGMTRAWQGAEREQQRRGCDGAWPQRAPGALQKHQAGLADCAGRRCSSSLLLGLR
jgi:hypothetical protein